MCKVKILLIVLFITNHFNHATTENYEEQFPDEEENIKKFIEEETKSFLDKLNTKREEENKDQITIEQIKNDNEVTEENEILIDILNNFSEKLKEQNEKRGEKIGYIEEEEEENKKYCYQITIEAEKGIMFTSDTHADAKTVEKIWYFFNQLKQQKQVDKLVFLGDYGDRGNYWTYTYFLLATMAEKYGEDIIFIRGNHEDRKIMENYSYEAMCAIENHEECTDNCWDEMPLICEITWNQKKIFCSHGAMPLNKQGEWKERETDMWNKKYFLANWNDNIFTEDLKQEIQSSYYRGSGYEIPIKKIFENMVNNEYDWSIHGHIHKNQCGILTTKNKRVVTVVANEYYYNKNPDTPFLPAVYIINNENSNGIFFNLLQKPNDNIKNLNKETPKNMKVLHNCVIYKYNFPIPIKKKGINENNQEKPTNKDGQKKHVNPQENKNKEKKIDCNILKTICCCCDICKK